MKVLIIEDELPAAEKLERYLHRYDPAIDIVGTFDSVEKSSDWLKDNQNGLDLIFMDIQLTDGLSFKIFDKVEVTTPVIFTTAFDQYAMEAFKVNSIDYLLKPIAFEDLSSSLKKLNLLKEKLQTNENRSNQLGEILSKLQNQKSYKGRFMVKLGEHIRSISIDQIASFYAEGRNAFLYTREGGKFIVDYKLEELEELLDPKLFFRVNRTFIININEIKDVIVYSNSRLKILVNEKMDKEIIVSREKVSDFKSWFDGKH